MKKILNTALALMLCAGMSACSNSGSSSSGVSGDFSSTAVGYGGDVTVTITMDNGALKDVAIEGKDETPAVGGAALDTLKQQILDKGNAEIDGVSGATFTSNAVKEAAEAAFAEAAK